MGMRATGQSSPRKDLPRWNPPTTPATIQKGHLTAVLAAVAAFAQTLAERPGYLLNIVLDTVRKGGTTTNLARIEEPGELPPSSGFLVGGVVKSTIVRGGEGAVIWKDEGLAIHTLARFIAANAYLLSNCTDRTYYLGTWVDESTGDVHIDVSEYVADGGRAIELARERGELAIWDLSTGTEKRIAG